MFIKWAKEVVGEWWKENKDYATGCYFFWIMMAWIITIAFVIVSNSSGASEDRTFVMARIILAPICVITGVIPTFLLILALIGQWIRDLYLDYQYFKANGGKRKRDEVQP